MQTIGRDMIVQYHRDNYVGSNVIVAAAGDVDHRQLYDACERFIALPKGSDQGNTKLVKPKFNPGISALESHLTKLVNMVAVH